MGQTYTSFLDYIDNYKRGITNKRIMGELSYVYHRSLLLPSNVSYTVLSGLYLGNGVEREDLSLPCKGTLNRIIDNCLADPSMNLILLGNIEDLHTFTLQAVFAGHHDDIFDKFDTLRKQNRLYRINGNNDLQLYDYDGLKLEYPDSNPIFFTHGHQGTYNHMSNVTKAIEFLWRHICVPLIFKLGKYPTYDRTLKSEYENSISKWTEINEVTTVCGYSQHPVINNQHLEHTLGINWDGSVNYLKIDPIAIYMIQEGINETKFAVPAYSIAPQLP